MNKILFYTALMSISFLTMPCQADHTPVLSTVVVTPDLITTGSANPDRRRVAGSALILKSEGKIDDASIPANAINQPDASVPENKIFDGKQVTTDVQQAPLNKEYIIK